MSIPTPCRLGRVEYDNAQYCFEHGGFRHGGERAMRCDRARESAALTEHEAGVDAFVSRPEFGGAK
jgi:hypothetical protein